MGKKRKWFSSVSHFSTMKTKAPSRRRSVEGLCASTLLGVLHSRTWLLDTHLIYLLERTQAGPTPPPRAHSLCSFSRTSSADGGNGGTIDIQTSSLDPLYFTGQGKLWFSSIFWVLYIQKLSWPCPIPICICAEGDLPVSQPGQAGV